MLRALCCVGLLLLPCNVHSAGSVDVIQDARESDLFELNTTDSVKVNYQNSPLGTPLLQPLHGRASDMSEPVVVDRIPGKTYYVAKFKLRTKLAEACDPTRGIIMRDGKDAQSLKFGMTEEGILVHRPGTGSEEWVRLPGVIIYIEWNVFDRTLKLTSSESNLIIITFHDVSPESTSILNKLACFAVSSKIHTNLPYPPLYSKSAIRVAICDVVNRLGDGVTFDAAVPVQCNPALNVRLVEDKWTYLNATPGTAWLWQGYASEGVFEFVSDDNIVKQYWMSALKSKASLLEAHPDVVLTAGALSDKSQWMIGDTILPPTPQPSNKHDTSPSKDNGDGDDDADMPWYAVVLISSMCACWICVCFVVGLKVYEGRVKKQKRRKAGVIAVEDVGGVGVQMDDMGPQPLHTPHDRENVIDKNPIDLLMKKEKRVGSVKGTPALSAGRGISDPSLDRYAGGESSLGGNSERGPALAAARRYHASQQHQQPLPVARTPPVDFVPGPGWESTMDATELSTASFSPSSRHSNSQPPPPYFTGRPSEGGQSTEATEGEYLQ